MDKLLKDYELETVQDYYEMITMSFIKGQRTQALAHFAEMPLKNRILFLIDYQITGTKHEAYYQPSALLEMIELCEAPTPLPLNPPHDLERIHFNKVLKNEEMYIMRAEIVITYLWFDSKMTQYQTINSITFRTNIGHQEVENAKTKFKAMLTALNVDLSNFDELLPKELK